MDLRSLPRRAAQLVTDAVLCDAEADVDRLLVSGAVVVREGQHFRIESGGDSWSELEARARRLEGRCDCGAVLSVSAERAQCRSCLREFPAR